MCSNKLRGRTKWEKTWKWLVLKDTGDKAKLAGDKKASARMDSANDHKKMNVKAGSLYKGR